MSLLRLPPEVLSMIFGYVPSSAFCDDLGLLTVSKHWHEFARAALLRDPSLGPGQVAAFAPQVSSSQPWFSGSLETMQIDLTEGIPADGPFGGDLASDEQLEPGEEFFLDTDPPPRLPSRPEHDSTWTKRVKDGLCELSDVCRQSRKLRELRVRVGWGACRARGADDDDECDYICMDLPMRPIQNMISAENLSVLVLDTHNQSIIGDSMSSDHVCPVIAARLVSLTKLHVRMSTMCPDLLRLRDNAQDLPLSNLVVNICQSPGGGSRPPMRCVWCSMGGHLEKAELIEDMRRQAEVLVGRMKAPRVARIITHLFPSSDGRALDVLTGKTVILRASQAWDGPGELMDGSTADSDELDDDFNGWLDSSDSE